MYRKRNSAIYWQHRGTRKWRLLKDLGQVLHTHHNLKAQKMPHERSCGTEMCNYISVFIAPFIWQTWKFNSEHHKSCKRWPGVTQSFYFLQGFALCHPHRNWLPDIKYFQWSIFVSPCYTAYSSRYLCFHKMLLALKPNILLTFKVCIFNPAKTALFNSLLRNWLRLLPSHICLKCQFVSHSPLSQFTDYHSSLFLRLTPVCPRHYLNTSHKTGYNSSAWPFRSETENSFIYPVCSNRLWSSKPSYGSYPENPLFSNKKVSDSFVLEKLIFTITYLPIFACLSRQSNFFWTPPSAATNISILLLL